MVWGGSLNKEGSNYLRTIKKADFVIQFLEELKEQLQNDEKKQVTSVISIIANYVTTLSEKRNLKLI
jgi:hypothetical protein